MPGLGTGVGGLDVVIAANKIRQAYQRNFAAQPHELELPTVIRF